jgi:hypothetical protein
MPAQWSKKRWGPVRVLAQPVAVPAPPATRAPLHPEEDKWRTEIGPKQFYFTAAGFEAAMLKAVAHFKATPLVRLLASLPC